MNTNLRPDKFFSELGNRVEEVWASSDYDELAFPDAAMTALVELPPCEFVSFYDCVKYSLLTDPLPTQSDLHGSFGQPPLTVYWGREFRIDLLFWVEGIPGIHQHGFSGAFHVLSGSSLQTHWRFLPSRRVVTRLYFGTVSLAKAEVLKTGANCQITPGNKMIHSTFHLERPSMTCVIRTNRDIEHLPQYSYVPPSIAYAPLEVCPTIERRLQIIAMLIKSEKLPECLELMSHVFERADTYGAFQYLWAFYSQIPEGAERSLLLSAARHKHPTMVDAAVPALLDQDRRQKIMRLRRSISNPDLQFFLALLLNIPSRPEIFRLIEQRYRSRAALEVVMGWIRELSQCSALEVKWPEPWFQIVKNLLSDPTADQLNGIDRKMQLLSSGLKSFWLLSPLFCDSDIAVVNRSGERLKTAYEAVPHFETSG